MAVSGGGIEPWVAVDKGAGRGAAESEGVGLGVWLWLGMEAWALGQVGVLGRSWGQVCTLSWRWAGMKLRVCEAV